MLPLASGDPQPHFLHQSAPQQGSQGRCGMRPGSSATEAWHGGRRKWDWREGCLYRLTALTFLFFMVQGAETASRIGNSKELCFFFFCLKQRKQPQWPHPILCVTASHLCLQEKNSTLKVYIRCKKIRNKQGVQKRKNLIIGHPIHSETAIVDLLSVFPPLFFHAIKWHLF